MLGTDAVATNLPGKPSLNVPVSFFWLPDKKEETYKRCWQIIRLLCPLFAPEICHSDMEWNLFKTFQAEFGGEIQFCYFHILKVSLKHDKCLLLRILRLGCVNLTSLD